MGMQVVMWGAYSAPTGRDRVNLFAKFSGSVHHSCPHCSAIPVLRMMFSVNGLRKFNEKITKSNGPGTIWSMYKFLSNRIAEKWPISLSDI